MPCTEMLCSGNYSDHSLNNPVQHCAFSVASSIHQIQNYGTSCDHTHIILFFRTDICTIINMFLLQFLISFKNKSSS